MSERLHDSPNAGRRIFRERPFRRALTLFAVIAVVGLGLSVIGGFLIAAAIQFLLAVWFCILLHGFRRLPFLDHRASRDRCGVVRSR